MRRRFRILIIDDHPDVLALLKATLDSEGFDVVTAQDALTGIRSAYENHPDAILLDVMMPDMDGFEACRRLREMTDVPIIFVTARGTIEDIVHGLSLGADDYVVKPYSLRELISRIRALLRRAYGELATAAEGDRIRFGEVELDLERLRVTRRGHPVELTPTEFRLLRYLVTHPNRPFSRDALIEAVWGYASDIGSARTVDVHIRQLRKKLGEVAGRDIETVVGVGYRFSDSRDEP